MVMPARRGTRFVPARDLEQRVAQRIAAPAVDRIAGDVAAGARRYAPPSRTWVTVGDDRVRKSHRDAAGQEIPANVRFVVGGEMLREPNDPTASPQERLGCRCEAPENPAGISGRVVAGRAVVTGSVARASVTVEFPRVVEAEFGNSEDPGTRFMGRATTDAARRLR